MKAKRTVSIWLELSWYAGTDQRCLVLQCQLDVQLVVQIGQPSLTHHQVQAAHVHQMSGRAPATIKRILDWVSWGHCQSAAPIPRSGARSK